MDHRNYEEYSLEQLYDALETVDEVEHPGQLKLIEERISVLEEEKNNINCFKASGQLTKWVKYFLYLQIIVSFIALVSGYFEYRLLSDYSKGVYLSEEEAVADGEANDRRQGFIGIVQAIIFVISGILILKWIHRANYNVRQLGAKAMQFTPGWSIGWYFIPIVNLWKPYQAMKEIWKASSSPRNWKETKVSPILGWWWFFWLTSSVLSNISLRLTISAEDLNSLMTANIVTRASDVSSIMLPIIFIVLVNRIYLTQKNSHFAQGAIDANA